jgi:pimeloyl-ACP methyl ester carboxylesterase
MSRVQPGAAVRTPTRLRRAYFDCRYGQLHVHNAIPAGGGFDELTTLICIHGAGQTGRAFAQLLASLGADRSVYALDLPGSGESDPSPAVPAVDAGVHAVIDFLESMRIRKADLVAIGDGAAVARRLAASMPEQVRRVVLLGEAGATKAQAMAQPLLALDPAQASAPGLSARLADFLR